jgi:hypothetical protein
MLCTHLRLLKFSAIVKVTFVSISCVHLVPDPTVAYCASKIMLAPIWCATCDFFCGAMHYVRAFYRNSLIMGRHSTSSLVTWGVTTPKSLCGKVKLLVWVESWHCLRAHLFRRNDKKSNQSQKLWANFHLFDSGDIMPKFSYVSSTRQSWSNPSNGPGMDGIGSVT